MQGADRRTSMITEDHPYYKYIHKEKPPRKSTAEFLGEKAESGRDREYSDAFHYLDRTRKGTLPMAKLEEACSMLGITFPPPDKRDSINQIADPAGNLNT